MAINILVIDDDPVMRDSCFQILSRKGCDVLLSENGQNGLNQLKTKKIDVVILDLKLPDMKGLDVLKKIKKSNKETVVIVITGYPTVDFSVKAMKMGAYDFIPKPFTPNMLRTIVVKALENRRREAETIYSPRVLMSLQGIDAIIGRSPVITELKQFIKKAAMSDCSVLITGETGTGKELIARALHICGHRKNSNFVTVDSGGLPDTLIESELFGHVKGSFTGAISDRIGRFEMAHKGTLFLDEVSNMSYHVQSRLLRALQEHEISRIGSGQIIPVDVRIISATNRDLDTEIKKGDFRKDLYYRLNVILIHLPTLRERREDIPVLANYFLSHFRKKMGRTFPERISDKALKDMMNHHWPGNVRELENVMERAVALCDEKEVNPFRISGNMSSSISEPHMIKEDLTRLEDVEKEHITKILKI
ncbi:MAG TPA: sigma-54-dependent Fis family transcriptional regulator, partial [bacterium]|nr:sigma-54-dependent Fis family transcriptional regulator [bacterium]